MQPTMKKINIAAKIPSLICLFISLKVTTKAGEKRFSYVLIVLTVADSGDSLKKKRTISSSMQKPMAYYVFLLSQHIYIFFFIITLACRLYTIRNFL